MKELPFTHGRLSFSPETYEMAPCLPEYVERRTRLFYLDQDGLMEAVFIDFDDLHEYRQEKDLVWLHFSGTTGDEFWIHLKSYLDLTDEQIKCLRSPHKQAYFEDHANGLFWTLQRPSVSDRVDALETINFFMNEKVLVTRQFSHDQAFIQIIHNLMSRGESLYPFSADRLAAKLMEDIIGSYVDVLKLGGTKLEAIQNRIILHPGKSELNLINRAQQVIWILLNAVWPTETVIQGMMRSKNPALTIEGKEELRYRYDEATSVLRLFETYRAMSYDLMDVYVSGLGLRTNETTMVLTIIATLFLPPTLIAGIYGMNFNIPEIHVSFGYYICLGAMFLVSGSLLLWLKIKGFINFG